MVACEDAVKSIWDTPCLPCAWKLVYNLSLAIINAWRDKMRDEFYRLRVYIKFALARTLTAESCGGVVDNAF
jgi:hypothetical protein